MSMNIYRVRQPRLANSEMLLADEMTATTPHIAPQPQPNLTAHNKDPTVPVLTDFYVEFTCLEHCNYNIRHTSIRMDANNPVVMLARAVYYASVNREPGMPPVTGISARCRRGNPIDLSDLRKPIREVIAIENGETEVKFRLHMPIGSNWIQPTQGNPSLASTVPACPSPAYSDALA